MGAVALLMKLFGSIVVLVCVGSGWNVSALPSTLLQADTGSLAGSALRKEVAALKAANIRRDPF